MSDLKTDSVLVEKTADMWITRKLLGEYVCDLYKLRVLYVTKDEEKIRENAHTYAGYDISAS